MYCYCNVKRVSPANRASQVHVIKPLLDSFHRRNNSKHRVFTVQIAQLAVLHPRKVSFGVQLSKKELRANILLPGMLALSFVITFSPRITITELAFVRLLTSVRFFFLFSIPQDNSTQRLLHCMNALVLHWFFQFRAICMCTALNVNDLYEQIIAVKRCYSVA